MFVPVVAVPLVWRRLCVANSRSTTPPLIGSLLVARRDAEDVRGVLRRRRQSDSEVRLRLRRRRPHRDDGVPARTATRFPYCRQRTGR